MIVLQVPVVATEEVGDLSGDKYHLHKMDDIDML